MIRVHLTDDFEFDGPAHDFVRRRGGLVTWLRGSGWWAYFGREGEC